MKYINNNIVLSNMCAIHWIKFFFVLFLSIVCMSHIVLAQNWQDCQTPRNTRGQCVPYNYCTYAVQIQTNYGNNIPEIWQTFLSNSKCFNYDSEEPFICCDKGRINAALPATIPKHTTTSRPTTVYRQTTIPSRPSPTPSRDETIFIDTEEDFESSLNRNTFQLLRNQTCGISNINRVSFGNVTRLGEYPWMALLRYDNLNQPFQCGGSLVSNRYVVTAAHCLVAIPNNVIGVRLGEHDITQEEDCTQRRKKRICYRAEDFGIEKIIPHPNYNRYKYINDVALIRMDREVVFKDNIVPICLPLTNSAAQLTEYPDKYILAGWGTTETGESANVMLKAELLPRSRSYCQNIFRRARIEKEHICAGGQNQVDSCKGDSGGPLFASTLYENTVRFVIYGVVSFGVAKCGDENSYPGIYTNVVQFMPWITNNIFN